MFYKLIIKQIFYKKIIIKEKNLKILNIIKKRYKFKFNN